VHLRRRMVQCPGRPPFNTTRHQPCTACCCCGLQAQEVLIEVAGGMIQASRAQRQCEEQAAREGGVDAEGTGTPPVNPPAPTGQGAEAAAGVKGVLPGSFAAHLERWKSKHDDAGKEVSDKMVRPAGAQ
jgi:hypothetical protein